MRIDQSALKTQRSIIMESDGQAGCPDCNAQIQTTASFCSSCHRPFPLLTSGCDFVRVGRIIDVLMRDAERARDNPSAATRLPLPSGIIDDLEAIRCDGSPRRDGMFFIGMPSSTMTQLQRWCFAVPMLFMTFVGIAVAAYQKFHGQPGFAVTFLVAVAAGLVLGFACLLIGRLFAKSWIAKKQRRLGKDRLLGDRREILFVAPEGLLQHSNRGLSFVPREHLADVHCRENKEEQRTEFSWVDTRTRARYTLESVGFMGKYSRSDLREVAAAAAALAGAG